MLRTTRIARDAPSARNGDRLEARALAARRARSRTLNILRIALLPRRAAFK